LATKNPRKRGFFLRVPRTGYNPGAGPGREKTGTQRAIELAPRLRTIQGSQLQNYRLLNLSELSLPEISNVLSEKAFGNAGSNNGTQYRNPSVGKLNNSSPNERTVMHNQKTSSPKVIVRALIFAGFTTTFVACGGNTESNTTPPSLPSLPRFHPFPTNPGRTSQTRERYARFRAAGKCVMVQTAFTLTRQ
jgi:hypothetical protein